MKEKNKNYKKIVLILFTLIFIGGGIFIFSSNKKNTVSQQETKAEIHQEVLENKSTGAPSDSGMSEEERTMWMEIWALRDMTPLETKNFRVTFDRESRLLEVYLLGDKADFDNWLQDNDLGNIPKDQFIYIFEN